MSIPRATTIGTKDIWAPPRVVLYDLAGDMRSGFVITNSNEVSWPIHETGFITRGAVYVSIGKWMQINVTRTRVQGGEDVKLAAGTIRIMMNDFPTWDDLPNVGTIVKQVLQEGISIPFGLLK